jgi:hypothetical protein
MVLRVTAESLELSITDHFANDAAEANEHSENVEET